MFPNESLSTAAWLSTLPKDLRRDIDSPFIACKIYPPLCDLHDAMTPISPDNQLQSLFATDVSPLATLINALDSSVLAQRWTSSMTRGTPSIMGDIFKLRLWLIDGDPSTGSFEWTACSQIIQSALAHTSVPEIWRTIFNIFRPQDLQSPPPPPPRTPEPRFIPNSKFLQQVLQTPLKLNSGSRLSMPTTHFVVDAGLREELHRLVYLDTPRFFETYFPSQDEAFSDSTAMRNGQGWVGWPDAAEQADVIKWFLNSMTQILGRYKAEKRNYYTSADQPVMGSDEIRKAGILLYPTSESGNNPKAQSKKKWQFNWEEVLVVGELKQARTEDAKLGIIIQLAGYVRLIFHSQHRRRFVHAFTLTGDTVRAWIFHRGGAFSSTAININQNPRIFLDIFVGYVTMSLEDLGFDTTLTFDRFFRMEGWRDDFKIAKNAFVSRKSIASRGTTCWDVTRKGDKVPKYVLKDSWRSVKHGSEVVLLNKASDSNVEGLVHVHSAGDVLFEGKLDDIRENIMKGLTVVGNPLKFLTLKSPTFEKPGLTYSSPRLSNVSSPMTPEGASKEIKSSISPENVMHSRTRSGGAINLGSPQKRKLSSPNVSLPKKRILADDAPEFDRIHTRILMHKGRNIYDFKNIKELLEGLHDAIEGHRSLYHAKILHRDISIFNIMLSSLDNPRADGKIGFLIDLDLAIQIGSEPSFAPHRTGTMEFMAIEVLRGGIHTYRHDLESFFYVFIWICVYRHWHHDGRVTPLRLWGVDSMESAASRKRENVVRWEYNGYETIEECFHEDCLGLKETAEKWRKVLFPPRDKWSGALQLGTPEEENVLYDPILGLLKEAADSLED